MKDLRNGFFHKNNMHSWETVEITRETTYLIFYLFLGAYRLNDFYNDLEVPNHDDFYKLCEFLNMYRNRYCPCKVSGHEKRLVIVPDKDIYYNKYGEPVYSGIYFTEHSPGFNGPIIKYTRENMPEEISIAFKPFEYTLIFSNGKFCGEEVDGEFIY